MAKAKTKSKKSKEQQDLDAGSNLKEVVRNEKGEITTWNSESKDGKCLKVFFDSGVLAAETASEVKDDFEQFAKHATRTLGSAIQNLRKQMKNQTKARKSKGSKSKFFQRGVCSCLCCFRSPLTLFLLLSNSNENRCEPCEHQRGRHAQLGG